MANQALFTKMAETVGFEPTCRFTDNSISSRARYDRFDTSPYDISNISPENLGRTDGENKGIFKMGKAWEALQ